MPKLESIQDKDNIQLEAIDNKGKRQNVVLTVRSISSPASIIKSEKDEASSADSCDPFKDETFSDKGIIPPPVNVMDMAKLWEQSTELGQNIRAMVTNTVGFGWYLKERVIPDTKRSKYEEELTSEKFRLQAYLESVHPTLSLVMLMEKVKWDQHSTGNGYLELIENFRGELVAINHVFSYLVRICEREKDPIKIMVPRVRPDENFIIENIPMYYRFRKFVMLCHGKAVWFKEAGDPRTMNNQTGKYDDDTPIELRAASLLQFRLYGSISPYGLPEWTGNLFSVYGSREAEEINFDTLRNNAIPSMFVICENGALTSGSIQRLKEWTEEQIQRAKNRSKFLILEGSTLEEGSPNPTDFKIKIEPLSHLQTNDQLFQDYDKNNRDKIRQSFRLPPLFVGRADTYNRATADTSRDIADEQIFAPERTSDTFLINRFILSKWKARFHTFVFNHPNITDDIELIRLMAMSERSGAMTPRRADRIVRDVFGDDIGPMPKGIDPDVPFSITFAEAQKGIQTSNSASQKPGSGGYADQTINNILNMRKSVNRELDSRFFEMEDNDE